MNYKTAKSYPEDKGTFNHIIEFDTSDRNRGWESLCDFVPSGGWDIATPIDDLNDVNDLCSKCLTIYFNENPPSYPIYPSLPASLDTSPVDTGHPVYITITNEPEGYYHKTIKIPSDVFDNDIGWIMKDVLYYVKLALAPKSKYETGQKIIFWNSQRRMHESFYRNDSDGVWRYAPSGGAAYEYRIKHNILSALAGNTEIEFIRAFTY